MSTLNIALRQPMHGRIRPLNIVRDLPEVADLVELCFHKNMDGSGRRYIQQMRDSGHDSRLLRWADGTAKSTSMPLSGYVWEKDKHIVGNISLMPFRKKGQRVFLISNVAVHPDYRRQGIARALTQMGLDHALRKQASSVWLHVRADNPGAIQLYSDLGFTQRALRTTWQSNARPELKPIPANIRISPRPARIWTQQHQWLQRAYPEEIIWYRMPDWEIFGTGIRHWLNRLFLEYDIRQWAVSKNGRVHATISWMQTRTRTLPIWLATAPDADDAAISTLLLHARQHLAISGRSLTLDYPSDQFTDAITAAGFSPRQTLVWMRINGAS